MSYIKLNANSVNNLCKAWFDKRNEECKQELIKYREELCTKRRLFGLLPPKYKKEDFKGVEHPTIFDSMNFQRMYPHYEIYDLMKATEGGLLQDVFVDVKIVRFLRS